ncbi:MAG TPA: hypothetical protein VFU81_03100, partial [Thermomicrobiales bacterium]|nr:hypothetical protein [Thermomicrobiales bacterium]
AEVDARLHTIVVGVGRAGLDLAAVARTVDAGIDRLISDLVAAARSLGRRARGLQTGLVHRELLLAAGAAAIVIVLLVLF